MTIYGVIDQSISRTNATYTEAGVTEKGTLDTTGNQSGLATQRFGFRGVEDLGGGLKARFQVESSLSAGNAGTNGFGSRPTFVGLEGGFGTILLGRQNNPLLLALGSQLAGGLNNVAGSIIWSPLNANLAARDTATQAALSPTNAAALGFGRMANGAAGVNNAIQYTSPTINGFQFAASVGQSDRKNTETGSLSTHAKADDLGASLRYASGPLTVAVAMHESKVNSASASLAVAAAPATPSSLAVAARPAIFATTSATNKDNYIGATYKLSMATLSVQHINGKSHGIDGVQNFNNKGTQFGVQAPISGALSGFASYGTGTRTFGPAADNEKFDNTAVQLGATYALSKRTQLYAIYGSQNLKGSTDVTRGITHKENQYALGVSHTF